MKIEESQKTTDHLVRIFDNLQEYGHSIQLLLSHVSKPLLVDDRGLHHALSCLKENLGDTFRKVDSLIEEMKNLDISKTFSEIKYIGKRLNEIEITLKKMHSEGIKKNIELEFRCDGYKMVKKPLNYDKKEPIEDPDQSLNDLIKTLDATEYAAIIHRFGLFGNRPHTYEQISEIIEVGREGARVIVKRGLKQLRDPKIRHLAEKITHSGLRKEIFGN